MIAFDFKAMSYEDAEEIRKMRNQDISGLRTPYLITESQQDDWYFETVCNRNANARWFSIYSYKSDDHLLGYTGIENISWENRTGEISLLVDSKIRGKGYGSAIVDMLLNIAFKAINLNCVYGECYYNNNAVEFWKKITEKYNGQTALLPSRKFWDGTYYDSLYFSITKDQYNDSMLHTSTGRE